MPLSLSVEGRMRRESHFTYRARISFQQIAAAAAASTAGTTPFTGGQSRQTSGGGSTTAASCVKSEWENSFLIIIFKYIVGVSVCVIKNRATLCTENRSRLFSELDTRDRSYYTLLNIKRI